MSSESFVSKNALPVAVVGARGYSGLELSRLLLRHPNVKLAGVFATDARFTLADYLPEAAAQTVPTWSLNDFRAKMNGLHTVFLATPAEVSIELAAQALAMGVNSIDLSGAFRLRAGAREHRLAQYKKWYALDHNELALLDKAHYGLQPFSATTIQPSSSAQLIANPGCYATATAAALIPLLRAGLIDASTVVVDAKSGTTGGGRKASESLLFSEVEGECLPYKIGQHQHTPEIVEAVQTFAGAPAGAEKASATSGSGAARVANFDPSFTTHLLSARRGIIASIYARLTESGAEASHAQSEVRTDAQNEARITAAFKESFGSYKLVRFAALGSAQGDSLLSLKRVVGSPRLHISYRAQGNRLYLFSTIDNLLKGAASQAIENFNRLAGFAIETSLETMEGVL